MTARRHAERAQLTDPLSMLSDAAVANLIATLRQLTDALELHFEARLKAERSAFNDDQLDMWKHGNPF